MFITSPAYRVLWPLRQFHFLPGVPNQLCLIQPWTYTGDVTRLHLCIPCTFNTTWEPQCDSAVLHCIVGELQTEYYKPTPHFSSKFLYGYRTLLHISIPYSGKFLWGWNFAMFAVDVVLQIFNQRNIYAMEEHTATAQFYHHENLPLTNMG